MQLPPLPSTTHDREEMTAGSLQGAQPHQVVGLSLKPFTVYFMLLRMSTSVNAWLSSSLDGAWPDCRKARYSMWFFSCRAFILWMAPHTTVTWGMGWEMGSFDARRPSSQLVLTSQLVNSVGKRGREAAWLGKHGRWPYRN